MQVSNLRGALLDYWVGKAFDMEVSIYREGGDGDPVCVLGEQSSRALYSPSTDQVQGGELIDMKGVSTICLSFGEWSASTFEMGDEDNFKGPTRLVAATRALVGGTFGETVPDLPA